MGSLSTEHGAIQYVISLESTLIKSKQGKLTLANMRDDARLPIGRPAHRAKTLDAKRQLMYRFLNQSL